MQVNSVLNKFDIKNRIYVRYPKNEKIVYVINIWKRGMNRFIKVVKPLKVKWAGSSAR